MAVAVGLFLGSFTQHALVSSQTASDHQELDGLLITLKHVQCCDISPHLHEGPPQA